jgi:hypothetical protein
MTDSKEEIFDTDTLLRRAYKKYGKTGRVIAGAFMRGRPPTIEAECSVNVERLIRVKGEAMTGALDGQRIIVIPASAPLDMSLPVVHAPQPGIYSHAHILDIPDEEACSKLASKSRMLSKEETLAYA